MFTAPPRQGNGRAAAGGFVPEGQGRAGAARGGAPPQQPGRGAAGPPPPQRSMPSHGFYVRHVKGIQFDNIQIQAAKEDLRPAFVLDDVQDADFFRIKVPQVAGEPLFALHNVADFSVRQCNGVKDTELPKADQKLMLPDRAVPAYGGNMKSTVTETPNVPTNSATARRSASSANMP